MSAMTKADAVTSRVLIWVLIAISFLLTSEACAWWLFHVRLVPRWAIRTTLALLFVALVVQAVQLRRVRRREDGPR